MVLRHLALNGMFWSSKVINLSRSSRVKSKMAPHLKIKFMVCRMTVEKFMLLSQFEIILQFYRPSWLYYLCYSTAVYT